MTLANAIAIAGPSIFLSVFLVKSGFWIGLWKKGNEQDAGLESLQTSLDGLKETVSNGFDRIYDKISDLSEHITDIRENYVSKDECGEIHSRLEKRTGEHEKRLSDLEKWREKHEG